MLTNGCTDSIMHNSKCVWPLPSVWKAGWTWSLTLSVEKNHPLTSQLPDRKRKIHEHPEGLGEVHLFPDITKWDTGRCCCSLSFGRESKRRLVPGERIHSGVLKAQTPWPHRGKGEASPFDPDGYSWDTLKASQYCPADSHNTALSWKKDVLNGLKMSQRHLNKHGIIFRNI